MDQRETFEWLSARSRRLDEVEKELAASRELLDCGHPKACWREADTLCEHCGEGQSQHAYYFTGHADPKAKCNNFKGDDRKAIPAFCTLCAELAASRADAYERAANECVDGALVAGKRGFQQHADACHSCASRIRALITPTDAAARAERDRRIRLEGEKNAAHICLQVVVASGALPIEKRRSETLTAIRKYIGSIEVELSAPVPAEPIDRAYCGRCGSSIPECRCVRAEGGNNESK